MEIGIKKIAIEEFDRMFASYKGRPGCGGSRREYFEFKKLGIDEAVQFKYETKDAYKIGKRWAIMHVRKFNLNPENTDSYLVQISDYKNFTVTLARKKKEAN